MPQIRDVLKHVSVETAKAKRMCRRTGTRSINKGDRCLVIATGPTNSPFSYSVEHAKPILDSAMKRLAALYSELDLVPPKID